MKSPEHEDWISSPSFCSQRGGRGISLSFYRIEFQNPEWYDSSLFMSLI